jgi:hypothetical protein
MSVVEFPAPRQQALQAKYICSACGEDRICNCNAPAIEKLAQKQEQARQASKAYRERKAEEKQQPRHMTEPDKTKVEAGNDVDPDESSEAEKQKHAAAEVKADPTVAPGDKAPKPGSAEYERDKAECIALHQRAVAAEEELAAFAVQCKRGFTRCAADTIRKAEQGAGLVHLKGADIDDEILDTLQNVVAAWTKLLEDVRSRRHDDDTPTDPGPAGGGRCPCPLCASDHETSTSAAEAPKAETASEPTSEARS